MGKAVKPIKSKTKTPIGATRPRTYASPIDKAKAYEVVWNQVSGLFDAARPFRDCIFVYLVGEQDGPIKIGLSKDPIGRLRTMQTGNPRRLRIEYVLLGDLSTEKLLHELWEPFAITSSYRAGKPNVAPGTEWFKAEARAELLPIIARAVAAQITHVTKSTGDVTGDDMERIIRDAHSESGFVAKGRDEIRLLTTTGSIVVRPSRI